MSSFLAQPISIFPTKRRQLAGTPLQVVISEVTNDTLTITKQPVQQGATITDHAYKEPTTLSMSLHFADFDEPLDQIYSDLLDLQSGREPFDVVTPKRVYKNMLISTIMCNTDKLTENILAITLSLQEVIIVTVSTTTVPRSKQRNPGQTGKTENVGKKSALASLKEGVGALFGGGQ